MESGEHGHTEEPDRDPDDAGRSDGLVRQEARSEQEREDGHGRLRDPRDARVDVLLPPRHEPEGNGGVQRSEHQRRTPVAPQLGEGVTSSRR